MTYQFIERPYTPTYVEPNFNTSYYFWLFILIHTLLWTVGPAWFRPTIPHDTLEGMTWGFQWQLGYNKHPFLTAWLSAGITDFFGTTGWPTYFLAQLAILVTFWASWRLATFFLPPVHALISALSLEGVLFYNLNSFNFTPDTLQSPLWALTALTFYRALTTQKIIHWFCTGFFAACCMCTKYQSALLLLTMFLFCLANTQARLSFKKPGIYCGIMSLLLFITPHLYWLVQHEFISLFYALKTPFDYTITRSWLNHLINPWGFLVNNIIEITGLLVLFWPFYAKPRLPLSLSTFQWQFLLYLSLGPIFLTLILCTLTGSYFAPRWGTPYYFAFSLLVMVVLKPALTLEKIKQFAISLVMLSLLLFTARMLTLSIFPRANSDAFLPSEQMALSLAKLWQEQYHSPLPFLAGSNYLVTSITPYMLVKPKPYLNGNLLSSPWINERELRQKGGLFIWDEGLNYIWDKDSQLNALLTPSLLARFPSLKKLPSLTFHRLSNEQPVVIGVAILPPNPILLKSEDR